MLTCFRTSAVIMVLLHGKTLIVVLALPIPVLNMLRITPKPSRTRKDTTLRRSLDHLLIGLLDTGMSNLSMSTTLTNPLALSPPLPQPTQTTQTTQYLPQQRPLPRPQPSQSPAASMQVESSTPFPPQHQPLSPTSLPTLTRSATMPTLAALARVPASPRSTLQRRVAR